MFHQSEPHFTVGVVQKFGPNVVGFQLATGARQWYIVGCYLAPDNTSTIESVVSAFKEHPVGAELLVAGDFRANLAEPEGSRRGEDIAAAMAMEVLEYMSENFFPVTALMVPGREDV